ncbi:MAG TPA: DNA mismatch repair protein MutS [Cyanobacteria bacterium UBA11991]|nr:DNA mismatch repair protein MutS [Cyanobacteriota bacterium]MDY6359245.1 DNA mismatch repair protein MutS [Cyanobacteriota bacterium]MDY6364560.1 DNA mismatch repair protein MutS [Cyanobacteriota bacterium]MDY6383497.1 DNA mismatch repair protein MutS [Cyanobacteriota bacterium]HCB11158.1 DNA mismatch repair protein MutS [Cyanobacteria bacterium UBA11991]
MSKGEINHVNSWEVNIEETTPAMQQYLKIKKEHPGILLWYRMGDFFETFFEDAVIMSKELELTLTGRDSGAKLGRVPLAGIPVKAADAYLQKLVQKNYKVIICDQLEDPKFAKGIVKRGITRVLTPGTLTESNLLKQNSNNYICAIYTDHKKDLYGFAYTDVSTGEFKVTQAPLDLIMAELARLNPSEIVAPSLKQDIKPFQIVADEVVDLPEVITKKYNCSKIPQSVFEENFAQNNLKAIFKAKSLESFGYSKYKIGFQAAGALLAYIWETSKDNMPKFDTIQSYELSQYMILDASTRKNLELTETLREKNKYGSLLWAIDKTETNMGARLLKNWICQPLKNVNDILKRQNVVSELVEKSDVRFKLTDLLDKIYDIQRLATRMSNSSASPKDFVGLKISLSVLPEILEASKELDNDIFAPIREYSQEIEDYTSMIDRTIVDNPPVLLKEGGIIKQGVSGELDYFRDLLTGGEEWLKDFEEKEKERTGIKTLKVGYNKVFGYFIEVTKSNVNMVPQEYIRKQTLVNAERFITDELKKHEDDVLSARFKSTELEYKLFTDFREYSKEYVSKIREIADCIAKCDALTSLAVTAVENNYCKPTVDESNDFIVKNGRHAVLEKILPLGEYVPNDLDIKSNVENGEDTQFMILTGPNMAGKSTYMRQNALIAILAQIGSWVPADNAKIGICDKIFTRVGASDDLTLGQSTFMVEMIETSFILNSATEKSFILLDEIGRGTSTYDGVAIAWSVAEYIATKIKARCIFATHYHELNVMTKKYPQIKNYRITIAEKDGEIEFLRKIVQGGASRSYGIQVAKMAGLPNVVIKRSQELMHKMQKDFSQNLASKKKSSHNNDDIPQLSLFGM